MSRIQPVPNEMPAPAAGLAIAQPASHPGGFLQKPFVQDLLPFLTSLSLHAAVLILGLLTYTAITIMRPPVENQVNPADATFTPPGIPGTPQSSLEAAMLNAHQDQEVDNTSAASNSFNLGKLTDLNPAGGGSPNDGAQIIDAGLMSGFGRGPSNGPGSGPSKGGGPGDGLPALFGIPSPGGQGVFIDCHGPVARKIAFVCDASGSMINKMASLKMELAKAVNGLKPIQSFSIIFFQDKQTPDMLDSSLVLATPLNKRKAGAFLEGIVATSTTNPIPGIEAAFRQQPQLIYLLTDGDFPDNQAVLSKIRELNKDKKVRVNTIAFVGSSDSDTAFIDLLKTVASENGGTFRHVAEEDLGQ